MIIKEYDFDNIPSKYHSMVLTLREYHTTIISNIITTCNYLFFTNLIQNSNYNRSSIKIFTHIYNISIFDITPSFSFNPINSTNANLFQTIYNSDVYSDFRIKDKEIIIGEYHEIISYLTKRDRKEKLDYFSKIKF